MVWRLEGKVRRGLIWTFCIILLFRQPQKVRSLCCTSRKCVGSCIRTQSTIDIVLTPCYADHPGILPKYNALQTPVVQCRIRSRLSKVPIRVHLRPVDAFKILTLNKRFDPLLDHIDFGLELADQLAESLKDELLMREFLALSATC